jgi:hypothetical protein
MIQENEEKGDRTAIYDGCFAKIDLKGRRKGKFWKERNGLVCEVISVHGKAVLVEIPEREELIICQVEDLCPATPS